MRSAQTRLCKIFLPKKVITFFLGMTTQNIGELAIFGVLYKDYRSFYVLYRIYRKYRSNLRAGNCVQVQDVKKGCLTKQVHGEVSGNSYVLVTVMPLIGSSVNRAFCCWCQVE